MEKAAPQLSIQTALPAVQDSGSQHHHAQMLVGHVCLLSLYVAKHCPLQQLQALPPNRLFSAVTAAIAVAVAAVVAGAVAAASAAPVATSGVGCLRCPSLSVAHEVVVETAAIAGGCLKHPFAGRAGSIAAVGHVSCFAGKRAVAAA